MDGERVLGPEAQAEVPVAEEGGSQPTEAETRQQTASKLIGALERMIVSAKGVGLHKSARALTTTIGTLGYEAADYRLPECSNCGQVRSEDEVVRKINRDRA